MKLRDPILWLYIGGLLGTAITCSSCNQQNSETANNQNPAQINRTSQNNQSRDSEKNFQPTTITEDEALIMVYADNINGRSYKLPVSSGEYFRFKQMSHRISNYAELINWVRYNNQTVKTYAEYMTQNANTPEEKAGILLDFVHTRIYDATIEPDRDYVKYPLETMVENNGDCEDLAILGAALMKSIGIDVALIYFAPIQGETLGHVGLGVNGNFAGMYFAAEGKKYYFAETCGTDWLNNRATWKIGEIQDKYASRSANIFIVR